MKKIAIVLGTRPEAIKLIPVYLHLRENQEQLGLMPLLISTGQHKEMLEQIFTFFGVEADINLSVMVSNQTLTDLASKVTKELGGVLSEEKPDVVIVQGDTTTAMIGALVGFYQRIPVAHVEAGLRTYNRFSPYPEEANRQMIGCLADIHFTPTPKATKVLEAERKDGIEEVGNTVIDSLVLCLNKVNKNRDTYNEKFSKELSNEQLVLVTGHRRENFGEGFENICNALTELSTKYPQINFVYPVHLNPNVKKVVNERLAGIDNIILINPLPYDELVFLMDKSVLILTDSGGIQEEAPSLNVPLLVMRDTTERQEGIDAGCAILVGTNKEVIVDTFDKVYKDKELYDKMSNVANPYGDGQTSKRIADYLRQYLS